MTRALVVAWSLACVAAAAAQEPSPSVEVVPPELVPAPPHVADEASVCCVEEPVLVPPLVFVPRPRPVHEPHFSVSLGGVFHQLYGIPYGTAALTLRGGADIGHFGIYGEGIIEAGAALPQLPLEHLRAGVVMQYVSGRVRFGAGTRLGIILVQRATTGDTNGGFTISVYAMESIDLFRWTTRSQDAYVKTSRASTHALYLGVEVGFDAPIFGNNANGATDLDISPMVALQLGVRL